MTFILFSDNRVRSIFCSMLIVFLLQFITPVKAYNLRKINDMENLSGSTVYSFYQDIKGKMWIGTNRGLDIYDGKTIVSYNPPGNKNLFTGNRIEKIEQTPDGMLWVQTYHGLYMVNSETSATRSFDMFNRIAFSDKDSHGNIFLIQGNNCIYYTLEGQKQFEQIFIPDLKAEDVVAFFIDENDKLWIFCRGGDNLCYILLPDASGSIRFIQVEGYKHADDIRFCSKNNRNLLSFIDESGKLYEFNALTQQALFIYDLNQFLSGKEDIASLLKFHDDYFIGFKTEGLFSIQKKEPGYTCEKVDIPVGITSLYKDSYQDIVWIGTTGQGVYTYSMDQYSIKSIRLSDFTLKMRQPVSALFVDKSNTLWLGSRGDGIARIADFKADRNIEEHRMEFITASGSALPDNVIQAFAGSREGNVWIGSEQGISYFILQENNLHSVSLSYEGRRVEYISGIYEQDSVLWISTLGMGIIKAHLEWRNNKPLLIPQKQFLVDENDEFANYFTGIYPENDSILWCLNKGEGLYRLNTVTWEQEHIRFEGNTVNEINALYKALHGNYLIGTNSGFVKYNSGDYKIWNEMNGFPANSVCGILFDTYSDYWLSTNRGLVLYNTDSDSFKAYGQLDGLAVLEFMEGASYRDEEQGILFFGGTGGFVTIEKNYFDEGQHYMPPLYFNTITIWDKEYPVDDFLSQGIKKAFLKLSHKQNYFNLSFSATDHLNGNNYAYYYRLGDKGEWLNNGNSNTISFSNLQPGTYRLFVKYYNKVLAKESYVYPIDIQIVSPWYSSWWAYIIYSLCIIIGVTWGARMVIKRNRKKKAERLQRLEQKHKEEIYDAKLQFFTNIAHEFCTPLTLISGPCNRLMEQQNLPHAAIKYTSIIRQNAERLNSLIQDLIEFNRIESGYKNPKIRPVDITTVVNEVLAAFTDIMESRKIRLEKQITPFICWNSDKEFIVTILLNLLSNAVKYAGNEKKIKVSTGVSDGCLSITVSNTGKGIPEKDIPTLFDRYHILQNFEQNHTSAPWSRNGLGLAISWNMVHLLKGTIDVDSIPGEWTHFNIRLPYPELTATEETEAENAIIPPPNYIPANEYTFSIPVNNLDELKPTLLVVDDEAEIRWFIADIFMDEYNVLTVANPVEAMEILKDIHPDVIISDVIMEEMDGLEFSRQIKSDETLAHIPFILLSARREIEGQTEGLDAGAEIYITKPFNADYLKSSVRRLLERKESLKEYFSSPLSSYTLDNGKLSHKEHKKFSREIIKIINKNIRNKELSAQFIAEKMNIGVRTLYRKLEELETISLTDLINDVRLLKAAGLLVKTRLTIDEIVFQSGFTNRSTFYRAFSKKYDCTPTAYRKLHS